MPGQGSGDGWLFGGSGQPFSMNWRPIIGHTRAVPTGKCAGLGIRLVPRLVPICVSNVQIKVFISLNSLLFETGQVVVAVAVGKMDSASI